MVNGHHHEVSGVQIDMVPATGIDQRQEVNPVNATVHTGCSFGGKYLQPPMRLVFRMQQRRIELFKHLVSVQGMR